MKENISAGKIRYVNGNLLNEFIGNCWEVVKWIIVLDR
jgi:hypothetical protein